MLLIVQPSWGARKKKSRKSKSKKPKINDNYDKATCTEVVLPMCRNLITYNSTQLIHKKDGQIMTQGQLSSLIEPLWAFMDTECSPQFRELVCGYYMPKCDPTTGQPKKPCRSVCRMAKRDCLGLFKTQNRAWPQNLRCNNFPVKNCVPASSLHSFPNIQDTGTRCIPNTIPMCSNLTANTKNANKYVFGFLPNMFLQNFRPRIANEVNNYNELVATGCSPHLAFFICGVYLPYCVDNQGIDGFRVPCREVCQEVFNSCHKQIVKTFNFQWPSKFQCHRYPPKEGAENRLKCLEPSELGMVRVIKPPNGSRP